MTGALRSRQPSLRSMLHPQPVWRNVDPSDLNPTRLEMDHEEHEVPNEPRHVRTSTVKKSVAAIAPQWALRNVFQAIGRRPAGSIPFSTSSRLIVFRPTPYPRFMSAPRMRVYPQRGFSRAIRTISFWISPSIRGRPGPLLELPSYFAATSSRDQRSSVSGVTMVEISRSRRRPRRFAFRASRRRCASVNRRRFPPSCSRRTRFSSCRSSLTSCWCRPSHPASRTTKNCTGSGVIGRR